MNKRLNAVTTKINRLDDGKNKVATGIKFKLNNDASFALEIPVPPTAVARALLRALLVEVGRHEQDQMEDQVQTFETAADPRGECLDREETSGVQVVHRVRELRRGTKGL